MKKFCIQLISAIALSTTAVCAWGQNPLVEIKTSLGNVRLELYPDKAPKSVANFLQYAKDGHYNGTIFHRVINGFMIQGGGFTPDMQQKPTRPPIALESDNGLKNETGTVAMARTNMPDSATSQFFINVKNNDMLNYQPRNDANGYAVFGRVVAGMDVVNRIKAVATTGRGMHQNVPEKDVIIESVSVVTPK